MSNLDENFTKDSKGCFLLSDTISTVIRNLIVLQDSRKRLNGYVESWQCSWCSILIKLLQKLKRILLSDIIFRFIRNFHVLQGSGKRLRGKVVSWQDSWCLILRLLQKLQKNASSYLTMTLSSSGAFKSSKAPRRELQVWWSLDSVPNVRSWWQFHQCCHSTDSNSRSIRNLYLLQDSKKRHGWLNIMKKR